MIFVAMMITHNIVGSAIGAHNGDNTHTHGHEIDPLIRRMISINWIVTGVAIHSFSFISP